MQNASLVFIKISESELLTYKKIHEQNLESELFTGKKKPESERDEQNSECEILIDE